MIVTKYTFMVTEVSNMKIRITRKVIGSHIAPMDRLRRSGFKEIRSLGNSEISNGYDMARL